MGGGLYDYSVIPSPIGLWIFYFFGFGIGSRGLGLGLGLDNTSHSNELRGHIKPIKYSKLRCVNSMTFLAFLRSCKACTQMTQHLITMSLLDCPEANIWLRKRGAGLTVARSDVEETYQGQHRHEPTSWLLVVCYVSYVTFVWFTGPNLSQSHESKPYFKEFDPGQ